MRSTGLLMAVLGGALLVLAVAPAPAEACPSPGQGWREPTVIVVHQTACEGVASVVPVRASEVGMAHGYAPNGGRSCHRGRGGQGALGFLLGFSSVYAFSFLRRRWRCGSHHGGC